MVQQSIFKLMEWSGQNHSKYEILYRYINKEK
jgi:hypothetical protein